MSENPAIDVFGGIDRSGLAMRTRWGIPREPFWIDGTENTAPAAGTMLVTRVVSPGLSGRVFGVHIKANEANAFQLKVGSATMKDFAVGAEGFLTVVLGNPLVDNIASGTTVYIQNVFTGTSVYQASILYDEG